jgi:hypothetical protein
MANLKDRTNEPLAQSSASSAPAEGSDKPPADPQAASAPPQQQAPSAVTKAQVEQLPAKYDNAPPSVQGAPVLIDPEDRESWGGPRPSFNALKEAESFRARTKDPRSAGLYSAGTRITPQGVNLTASGMLARGEVYLRTLVADEDIELKISK